MDIRTVFDFVVDDGNRSNEPELNGTKNSISLSSAHDYEEWGNPVRALAIAAEMGFNNTYRMLEAITRRKKGVGARSRAKNPMWRFENKLYRRVLEELGWTWVPCMHIGGGMNMHLRRDEVPLEGRFIFRLSHYYVACIDGIIHDVPLCEYANKLSEQDWQKYNGWKCECTTTSTACRNLTRDGTRGVYGYWEDQRLFTPQAYRKIVSAMGI